jgi:hypothetical protein
MKIKFWLAVNQKQPAGSNYRAEKSGAGRENAVMMQPLW